MLGRLISSLLAFLLSFNSLVAERVEIPQKQTTTILFAGDVMLGRSVMEATLDSGNYFYPFSSVAGLTRDADITFVNLENPVIKDCPRTEGGFTFCTNYEIAKGIRDAGIDVVTLSNNHSGNYGERGLEETKVYLDSIGILWTDGEKMATFEKNGVKFGFLGFDYVFKPLRQEDLELVKSSDPLVDVLIVSPHWGDEYTSQANNFQKETVKKFIESGADLIVGHHPHWAQNNEIVENVPVYYSLGNFIFDQMWSEETKKGKLVKFTFEDNKIINTEEYNSYISKVGQPEIVNGF